MDLSIQLIVKVQQFEDKRIEANRLWNVKELKGRLSEIYPTVSRTKKFRAKLEKIFLFPWICVQNKVRFRKDC